MRRGDYMDKCCTICGKEAGHNPGRCEPTDHFKKMVAAGFEYTMVKSGEDPIYQWQCRECRELRERPCRRV